MRNTPITLAADTSKCQASEDGIKETSFRLTNKTPLVGLHGEVKGDILVSLGLIFVETQDKKCQIPLEQSEMEMYEGLDEFDTAIKID